MLKTKLAKQVVAKLCGMSTIIIMLIVFAVFSVASSFQGVNFLSGSNVSTILNQASFLVIVGVAQAIVILTGGVNMSIGALMSFSTVLWGNMLMKSNSTPFIVPCLLVLLTGAVVGLINGLLITKLKIVPFIATFATMYVCRGLSWLYLRNQVLYNLDTTFREIATGRLFKIGGFMVTAPMVIAVSTLAIAFVILRYTNAGRTVYFTGSNRVAAQFSGINTDRVVITVHVISSILAAFAGLMYVARLNSCEPGLAADTHFEAITISLIGGFIMSGGYGNIWGIAGGAVIVYTIQSGINSLQLPAELQKLVNGLLIIIAVFINLALTNKKMALENDLQDAREIQKQRRKAQLEKNSEGSL